MLRIAKLFIAIIICLSTSLAVASVPVFAQSSGDQTAPEITQGLCAGVNLSVTDTNCHNSNNGAVSTINRVIHTIINLLSVVVGVVAVIMIIVGGLRYITSGGSDTSVTGAKNTILYAVIGLIIVALAQLIVRFVLNKLTQ